MFFGNVYKIEKGKEQDGIAIFCYDVQNEIY